MTEFFRGRFFGYEIQHILPEQILNRATQAAQNADDFLRSIDFNIQARGNKIPLLSGELVRNAILAAPQAIQDIFTNAGFGFNRHDSQASGGNHAGYNQFIIELP